MKKLFTSWFTDNKEQKEKKDTELKRRSLEEQLKLAFETGRLKQILDAGYYKHDSADWINYNFFYPLYQYHDFNLPPQNIDTKIVFQLNTWLSLINPEISVIEKMQLVENYALIRKEETKFPEPAAGVLARELDIIHPLIALPFLLYAERNVLESLVHYRRYYLKATEQPKYLDDHIVLLVPPSPFLEEHPLFIPFLEGILEEFSKWDTTAPDCQFPNDHRSRALASWRLMLSKEQFEVLKDHLRKTSHHEWLFSLETYYEKHFSTIDLQDHDQVLDFTKKWNPHLNLLFLKHYLSQKPKDFGDYQSLLAILLHLDLKTAFPRRCLVKMLSRLDTKMLIDSLFALVNNKALMTSVSPAKFEATLALLTKVALNIPFSIDHAFDYMSQAHLRGQKDSFNWLAELQSTVIANQQKNASHYFMNFLTLLKKIEKDVDLESGSRRSYLLSFNAPTKNEREYGDVNDSMDTIESPPPVMPADEEKDKRLAHKHCS